MIKAVIFDLDGVLTRSDHYHTAAWRQTCQNWGIPFEEATGDLVRGVSRVDSARIVARQGGADLPDGRLLTFAEEKNEIYVRLLQSMGPEGVIPGVEDLLRGLQRAGIPMAVASSSKNAPLILRKTGLEAYFTAIIDGSRITRSKPDPEVFRKAADALGAAYEDCLVVEDAASGAEAALALGAKVAAIGPNAAIPGVSFVLHTAGELAPLLMS